jgi:predicted nucleic acid-binding protein
VKPTVYLETTVVSYLTARRTRDLIIDARQALTGRWWTTARKRFDLYVSAFVIREAGAGDVRAAKKRLDAVESIPLLALKPEAVSLAKEFIAAQAIPAKATEDAMHIAVGTVHGMEYLVTWNFAHIANATMRGKITEIANIAGFRCPVICTPEELMDR